MKVKEESEKTDLKLNIQKTKIMASSPITSWHIDDETMETVRNFILGGLKWLQMLTTAMKLKEACSLDEKLLKSFTSDWELNPHGWDLNPAKTVLGTWTHVAVAQTQPNPTVPGFRT